MLGWTPKGETNGLSTLNVQKAYQIDVGDTVSVFCGRREKISIIHNNNQAENLFYSEDNFSTFRGVVVCVCVEGVKFLIFHNNNLTENLVYSEDKFSTKINILQIVENYPLPPPEILRRGANTKYA